MAALAIHHAGPWTEGIPDSPPFQITSSPCRELDLFPWASQGRNKPLQVWGLIGADRVLKHCQGKVLRFDNPRQARCGTRKFFTRGIKVVAPTFAKGVVYEANGVKVTAFLVRPWTPFKPCVRLRVGTIRGAFGSPAGDTKPLTT